MAPSFTPRFSEEEVGIINLWPALHLQLEWDGTHLNETTLKKGQGHNLEIHKAKGAFGQGHI